MPLSGRHRSTPQSLTSGRSHARGRGLDPRTFGGSDPAGVTLCAASVAAAMAIAIARGGSYGGSAPKGIRTPDLNLERVVS